jgi:hypothetical protein
MLIGSRTYIWHTCPGQKAQSSCLQEAAAGRLGRKEGKGTATSVNARHCTGLQEVLEEQIFVLCAHVVVKPSIWD